MALRAAAWAVDAVDVLDAFDASDVLNVLDALDAPDTPTALDAPGDRDPLSPQQAAHAMSAETVC
ncbi:hypothetical protein WI92_10830 [Burkholderia vietnamiensis]|uniref:hypothetical protein n=1 Tax=Burkholderia vietnamiensis TaxID=60552 RepID=UPI0007587D1A|nr:hypothetical protein [Burkholderia vietnamiensis]KVE14861.1 hypothetical protein WI92_10830 [Burkholderia vietnamiensis]